MPKKLKLKGSAKTYKNFRTNTGKKKKKRYPFYHRELECKIGSQETPGVTGKFGLEIENEAGQRLTRVFTREHTCHSKHPFPTTQEMTLHRDITRWPIPKSD